MNSFLKVFFIAVLLSLIAGSGFVIHTKIHSSSQDEPIPVPEQTLPPDMFFEEKTRAEQESLDITPLQEAKTAVSPEYLEYQKATVLLREGKHEEAIESFREVVGVIPDALIGMGIAYYSLKEHDKAKYNLEQYLEERDNFIVRKLLSFIYYSENELDDAILHAEKGLEMQEDRELRALHNKIVKDKNAQQYHIKDVSSHFDIYYDGYGQRDAGRKIVELLEDAYSEIGKAFGYFPSKSIPVILYTDKEFHDVTDTPSWTGGLYDGKIRLPLKGAETHLYKVKKVIYHEYSHALVYSITSNCPVWLNEGLAEYFENGPIQDTRELIPLENLAIPFSRLNPSLVESAYRTSHSAVTRLIDKYGMYRIEDLLFELSKGRRFEDAFFSIYPISFTEFRREWSQEQG